MTKRFLLVMIALFLGSLAYADDSTHKQACEEYIDTLNMDKMIGPMYGQINKMQEEMIAAMKIPDDIVDITKDHMKKVNELMKREMSWESMKQDFIDIHVEVFSESEMREMTKFYKSPVGKKYIEKSPELMQKFFLMSQKRIMNLLPKIEKLTEEFKQEVQQREKSKKRNFDQ